LHQLDILEGRARDAADRCSTSQPKSESGRKPAQAGLGIAASSHLVPGGGTGWKG